MNSPHTVTTRLIAAAVSGCATLALFSSVVAISEPQRGLLMARLHQPAAPQAAVRLAMADAAQAGAENARR